MKKFLIILAALLITVNSSYSAAVKNYKLKLDSEKYYLLYSAKTATGYINEYYRTNQTYNNWTEMFGVHYFTDDKSPIEHINDTKKYLDSIKCPHNISFDKSYATIEFIMTSRKRVPVVTEYNIYKYDLLSKNVRAIQYARRYLTKSAFEEEAVKKEIQENRERNLKRINKMGFPQIVVEEIDKCGTTIANKTQQDKTLENKEENVETAENLENTEEIAKENTEEVENPDNSAQEDIKEEIVEENDETNESLEETIVETKENSDINETESQEAVSKEENEQSEQEEIADNMAPVPEFDTEDEMTIVSEEIAKFEENDNIELSQEQNITEEKEALENKVSEESKDEIEAESRKEVVQEIDQDREKIYQGRYILVNDKKDFYAKPRNYKEVRKENERRIKEEKRNKSAKKRVNEASKKLNED